MKASAPHRIQRGVGAVLAGIFASYLLARGIAEFFTLNYSNSTSYRNDWGGPSLPGVLAVHSGPAVIVVVALFSYVRWWRHKDDDAVVNEHRDSSARQPAEDCEMTGLIAAFDRDVAVAVDSGRHTTG